jgi:hypothetical protein
MNLTSSSNADGYSFSLDLYKGRLKLTIYFNEDELASRKEEVGVLTSFFRSTGVGIFQGQIKLRSELEYIIIYRNGQCLGKVSKNEIESVLSKLIKSDLEN